MEGCCSQPRTRGPQHPLMQKAEERKGRHSPGSQLQPGGKKERERQEDNRVRRCCSTFVLP